MTIDIWIGVYKAGTPHEHVHLMTSEPGILLDRDGYQWHKRTVEVEL